MRPIRAAVTCLLLATCGAGGRSPPTPRSATRTRRRPRSFGSATIFFAFGKPRFDEEEIAAVADVLRSGWISTGPRTQEFQKRFAAYTGCAHALGLSSCTAALYLALRLLDVKDGDEVIVPPLTFAATANVVVHCGARPIFADVDAVTGLLDPAAFERAITPRTKAVILVHLYGQAVLPRVTEIARSRQIAVVADCAHATETRAGGAHVCKGADFAAFSFYATKNLAVGEGGMLVSDNADAMARAETLSLHGMSRAAHKRYSASGFKAYEILEAGYKFNMMDITAALGLGQLDRIEKHLALREKVWARYDEAFRELPLDLPPAAPTGITHARHLYTIRVRPPLERAAVIDRIQSCNIGVGIHFIALHEQPFYTKTFGTKSADRPNASAIAETTISIPMTPYLTDADVQDVIAAVRWAVGA